MSAHATDWAWNLPIREPIDLLVLLKLADSSRGDGAGVIPLDVLAKACRCGEPTALVTVARLEKAGYLTTDPVSVGVLWYLLNTGRP